MSLAALSLGLALLGVGQNPHQRFLEQKEWYGHVECRVSRQRSRRNSDGGTKWRVERRAEIDFRIEINQVLLAEINNMKLTAKAFEKRRVPLPPQFFEGLKMMEARMNWQPDPKKKEQQEILRVNDSYRRWDRCGGGEGCSHGGVDHCSVVMSEKRTQDGNGHPQNVASASLQIDVEKGTFDFHSTWVDMVKGSAAHQFENPEDGQESTPPHEVAIPLGFGVIDVEGQALPSDGLVLAGVEHVIVEYEGRRFRATKTWTLSPKPLKPINLRFELEDYETWRPKGSKSESEPGNDIRIDARLSSRGGGELEEQAKVIEFSLDEVSNEPGICINYPPKPKTPADPDLRFVAEWNPDLDIRGDGTVALRIGEGLTEATAILSSFDWGAFGMLEVVARLQSGRIVVGELKDSEGVTEARLPKSAEGSWIADAWKEKTGATGEDDADEDAKPVGDARYKGDGLTLYEEYRGWHEMEKRAENEFDGGGDPNTKELFVCDQTGGWIESADLEAFRALTGLRVIGDLVEWELAKDRVVNFNHGDDDRHRVAQHGVVVLPPGGLGDASGSSQDHEAGTPAWRGVIFMPTGPTGPAAAPNELVERFSTRRALIHELLHSCNVRHHAPVTAEERTGVRWTLKKDEQDQPRLMEGAYRIRVLRESDEVDVTSEYLDQLRLPESPGFLLARVGSWQGAGSGHPNCIMAAGSAKYFRSRIDPLVRYLIRPGERGRITYFLCDSRHAPKDSDNGDAHRPEPHFGSAPEGGGDCIHQIVVNDGAHPRPR